jgi:hypothetical protein
MLKGRSAQHTPDARLSLHHVAPHAAAAVRTAAATATLAADTVAISLEPERESDQNFARREGATAALLGRQSVPGEHGLPTGTLHCERHR